VVLEMVDPVWLPPNTVKIQNLSILWKLARRDTRGMWW
jgi:hypothetical protein